MHAASTFAVSDFEIGGWQPTVKTGVPFGEITMVKTFAGDIVGKASTRFLGGLLEATSTGGYVAVEHFKGTIDGRTGTCVLLHMQTIADGGIGAMHLAIVPGSGTGDLIGINGSGGIKVDADGTHRLWLDYEMG